MHFIFYVIFAPLLVALAAGSFLFVWSQHKHSGFGKFMGSLITLVSLILIALQTWSVSTSWHKNCPQCPWQKGMQKDMQKMMKQMPESQQ